MFSKKATKIDEIFIVDLTFTILNVKLTAKISSKFLENINFKNFFYVNNYDIKLGYIFLIFWPFRIYEL